MNVETKGMKQELNTSNEEAMLYTILNLFSQMHGAAGIPQIE